ncbi:outer membrane lipoprotein-sorting protein [Candidatus Zixiibacteriota bacterium]
MYARATAIVIAALFCLAANAGQAADTAAARLMNEAHHAFYYARDGAQAQITMSSPGISGRFDEYKFWLIRRDSADLGDQRYLLCFFAPDSLARMTFLVHKKANGQDNRWQYLPAADRVLRIPAANRRDSFLGMDFTHEDISGRLPALDDHNIIGPDSTIRRPVTKVKSTPLDSTTADYAYRISWIDNQTKLPLKEEYFAQDDKLVRIVEIGRIEIIEEIPTPMVLKVTDLRGPGLTTISISEITYQTKLRPKDFNQELLKKPPAEFTK